MCTSITRSNTTKIYILDSSSKTSSDYHSDVSSNFALRHSPSGYAISDSPSGSSSVIFAGPSRKRCRSPTTSVSVASPVHGALSPVRADLLPPQIGLGVDVEDSYEPYTEPDIDPDVQSNIDACIVFANDIAARGTDPVREDFPELVSADGSLEVMQRGLDVVIQELYDHMMEIPVHKVRVIESIQRDQGHKIIATSQQSAAMLERIGTLERDNRRLKGMLGVERQRVDRLWRSMSTMPTATRYGMTQDAINELIAKCMEEALKAYDAARNLRTKTEMEDD
ncbi:hypothetical protein Tco_0134221 [Tanacetum coccineum]